jgi:uncharacterized protein (DUF305 family)
MPEGKRHGSQAARMEHAPSRNILLLVVASVAIVVAGASLSLFVTSRPPGNNSPEAGFARDMMVHHAQAVQMAEIVRDRTESEEIRALAKEIALNQRAEIGHMQGWLAAWGLPGTSDEPAMSWMGHPTEGNMPGMATPEELNRLMEAPPDQADTLFLLLMIPHHRGAVPMAEAVLDRTDRSEVRQLAEFMAASQRQEIELMRGMLRGGDVAPVEIALQPTSGSGVSGTATFAATEDGVEVKLEVRNPAQSHAAYLAHVHSGSCAAGDHTHERNTGDLEGHERGSAHGAADEIEHPLSPVEPDERGYGSSTTMLEGITLEQVFSEGPTYVNVHAAGPGKSPQLACANLNEAN